MDLLQSWRAMVLLCLLLPGGRPSPCGVAISPEEPAVELGSSVVLNCTSSCGNYSQLGWEVSVQKMLAQGPGWVSLHIPSVSDWHLDLQCFGVFGKQRDIAVTTLHGYSERRGGAAASRGSRWTAEQPDAGSAHRDPRTAVVGGSPGVPVLPRCLHPSLLSRRAPTPADRPGRGDGGGQGGARRLQRLQPAPAPGPAGPGADADAERRGPHAEHRPRPPLAGARLHRAPGAGRPGGDLRGSAAPGPALGQRQRRRHAAGLGCALRRERLGHPRPLRRRREPHGDVPGAGQPPAPAPLGAALQRQPGAAGRERHRGRAGRREAAQWHLPLPGRQPLRGRRRPGGRGVPR
ncbi:intercellular adhesion molecule 4 isoform X1 [Apteryx mantelli]|uniref:Intercellular adhesion molecule 4 isoform X1 n=1 Tax=Apteryx mantelli TaxID=2696672 RepID=A0ABM4G0P7_9AVES